MNPKKSLQSQFLDARGIYIVVKKDGCILPQAIRAIS